MATYNAYLTNGLCITTGKPLEFTPDGTLVAQSLYIISMASKDDKVNIATEIKLDPAHVILQVTNRDPDWGHLFK